MVQMNKIKSMAGKHLKLIPGKHNMSIHVLMTVGIVLLPACSKEKLYLESALNAAGDNRHELELVLEHYRSADADEQKYEAACFLISNMPAHYSYSDMGMKNFNDCALRILEDERLNPHEQHDSIRRLFYSDYYTLAQKQVSDIRIMSADYLIYSIDNAFGQWRSRTWNDHVDFEQFKEWLLPYKVSELQPFDDWRGLLSESYCDGITALTAHDIDSIGTYGVTETVRSEINEKNPPNVFWQEESGPALLDARCLKSMTYGTCHDYVSMGTLVFRSLGIPAAVDQVPCWGRNSDGHSWFVFLSDNGRTVPTINSLIMPAGIGFYQYERIPKVWRSCYAINRRTLEYMNTARHAVPFNICAVDVTHEYGRAYDIEVPLSDNARLRDRYVYIAMVVNQDGPSWKVLDFGETRGGKAYFRNMGGNMLYVVLGFDGKGLVPVSDAFVLGKDGCLKMIPSYDKKKKGSCETVRLGRKYYESYNVTDMRHRLVGGAVECSESPEFSNPVTAFRIDSVFTSVCVDLEGMGPWRCWRYRSPDGSYGSLAEMELKAPGGADIIGGLAISNAGHEAALKAFDGDMLSNFESDQPDGNWVGVDYGSPCSLGQIRLYPRSDDNDIVPGLDYELLVWDGLDWDKLTSFRAKDGFYDAKVPKGVLLWLRCLNRGTNERPFVVDNENNITWW